MPAQRNHCSCEFDENGTAVVECLLHQSWRRTLEFYADPKTYYAIGFFPDPPNGPFMKDFSHTAFGKKPGKKAREALES